MPDKMTELKPCPFCGSDAFMNIRNSVGNDDIYVKIYSVQCGSIAPCIEMAEYDTREEAKRYWNRRAV